MREKMQRPAPIHSVRLAGKHWSSPGRDVPAYLAESIDPYLDQVETERDEALARAEKAEGEKRSADESFETALREIDLHRERREQAERERDEARSELDRCKAFCRERIQEIHQWERWADLSPRGINVDAPPSNAMRAAAEELRAQGAEVSAPCPCGKCPGYRFTPDGQAFDRNCPACNGTGRKTEESDAQGMAVDGQAAQPKAPAASVHEEPVTGATERAQPSASGAPIVGDGAGPVVLAGAGAAGRASSPAPGDVPPEVTRPSGIPASATIWAEVVDGLGRKVGAWFEENSTRDGSSAVRMFDPSLSNDGRAWFWTPGNNAVDWDGSLDRTMTPSAAAQCRQLYERGMAEQAKVDAFVERVEQAAKGDPARIAEAIVEARTRPACIPSHIADTDWTVIEGRAVWRDGLGCVRLEDRTVATFGGWLFFQHNTYESLRGMQRHVPQSLFLAARRWMGWEKEEPTIEQRLDAAKQACEVAGNALLHLLTVKEEALTRDRDAWKAKAETLTAAVDLTELREAYVALNGMYAGNKVGPLLGSVNDLVAAVEKLLSSGGAP